MFRFERSASVAAFSAAIGSVFCLFVVSAAQAQAPAPAAGTGGPAANPLMQLIPFLAIFAIMYFMMIRPQAKKQKLHQEFLANLKRGDEVLTASGFLGRIEGLTDLYITLELAPNVRIKILRSQIASYVPSPNTGAAEVKA